MSETKERDEYERMMRKASSTSKASRNDQLRLHQEHERIQRDDSDHHKRNRGEKDSTVEKPAEGRMNVMHHLAEVLNRYVRFTQEQNACTDESFEEL